MATVKISKKGLEKLDFTPELPCSVRFCRRNATKVVRCLKFPSVHQLVCDKHLRQMKASAAKFSLLKCSACGAEGPELSDICEIVDL